MASKEAMFGWIGVSLNIIMSCTIIHGLQSIYSKRNIIQWSARQFDVLFYILIWSILFVIIESNVQLCGGILGLFNFSVSIQWFLNNLFGLTLLGLLLLRAWLIHFDFHSCVALVNLVLNPELSEQQCEHLQWFLDNKINYGSPKYLTRFMFIMITTINLFLLGWSLLSENTFIYAIICTYVTLIIISISITKHLRVLDDNFFITKEMKIEFRIFALMFIIGGCLIIFGPVIGFKWLHFLLTELSVLCITLICWISTYWVMKQTFDVGLDSKNGKAKIQIPYGSLPLVVALTDSKVVMEFTRHLVHELSVENIFFLSDIMTYKQSFVKQQKMKSIGFACHVSTNMSRLMYRRSFTHYAWAISKTYIDGSSSFYVTAIENSVRDNCMKVLEELDPCDELQLQKLQIIFDQCAIQVYEQLQQSYNRFAYTNIFKYRIAATTSSNPQIINLLMYGFLRSITQIEHNLL
eukprot:256688_1